MKKNLFYKFICLLLIFGLNWFGILSVINAFAFFDDVEKSEKSYMNSAILDFSIQSENDFFPQMTPREKAAREFNVVNDGSSDINYDILILINNSGLCRKTNINVLRNGNIVYTGNLVNFNLSNLNLEVFGTDNYIIESTLQDFDNSLWGKTCEFDLMFSGLQTEKIGFSDKEILGNVLESGVWEDETPIFSAGDVVINEIMWMGSKDDNDTNNSGDEWIELRNMTDHEIDIGKWEIENAKSANKTYMIPASRSIPAYGYFLIANHPEESNKSDLNVIVGQPNASMSYNNNYNDNGQLVLKDSSGNIVDVTPLPNNTSWPSGLNETNKKWSMERNLIPGDGSLAISWHTCDSSIMEADDLAVMKSYWDTDAQEYNCGTPGHENLSKNDSTATDYDSGCVNPVKILGIDVESLGSVGDNNDMTDKPGDGGISDSGDNSDDPNTEEDMDEKENSQEAPDKAEENDPDSVGSGDFTGLGEKSDTGNENSENNNSGDESDNDGNETGGAENNDGNLESDSEIGDSIGVVNVDGGQEVDSTDNGDSIGNDNADTEDNTDMDSGEISCNGEDSDPGSSAKDLVDSLAGDNILSEN